MPNVSASLLFMCLSVLSLFWSAEQCRVAPSYTDERPYSGRMSCMSNCLQKEDLSAGAVVQWDIHPIDIQGGAFCKRIILRSNGTYELHAFQWTYVDGHFRNSTRVFKAGADAAELSRSSCGIYANSSLITVDPDSAELVAHRRIWEFLISVRARVKCSMEHPTCSNDEEDQQISSSFLLNTADASLNVWQSDPKVVVGRPARLSWPYGSTQPRMICLSVDLFNSPSVVASHNGSVLPVSTLEGEGQPCSDCTSPACLGRARQSAAAAGQLNRDHLYVWSWQDSCGKAKALAVLFFDSVTSEDRGDWVIDLQTETVAYTVSVESQVKTEFVQRPFSTYDVAKGKNVNVTCKLAAPIDQSDDTAYWTGPAGNTIHTLVDVLPQDACRGRGSGETVAVRESHTEYSEAGAFRLHTLVLHVCEAGPQDQGAYYCRLDGLLPARAHLAVQPSSDAAREGEEGGTVSVETVLLIVLAVVIFLIAVLIGVAAFLCCCLLGDDLHRHGDRRSRRAGILQPKTSLDSHIDAISTIKEV